MNGWRRWLQRRPLWTKLAAFAALGVILTHAAHLVFANQISSRALAQEQDNLGRTIARMVAHQAADAVLVDDVVTLHELVSNVATGEGIAYCFIARNGRVIASSIPGPTPPGLVALSHPEGRSVVASGGDARYLDISEPILGGAAGEVRLGMDLAPLAATRRKLAVLLGSLALVVILVGVGAALVVGRGIARPLGDLLDAADRFDPAAEARPVVARGGLEIARLADRFNLMMQRLGAAHEEQAQARQKAIATERLVALGSLVAGVAHEVNNPIAGMKTCLRRLRTEELSPETREEYLELLEEGVRRVENVMSRLLDFARPRSTSLVPVGLAEVVREGTVLLPSLLHKRRIILRELSDGTADCRVLADRRQIAQALLNLVLNAAYVTPEGGEIRIRLRRKAGRCGISVEDDGPGIPAPIRSRILDPFFSTKPEGEGTGLGLSVTRTIVEAHGGELGFEFPERGTVATLWLRPSPEDARPRA